MTPDAYKWPDLAALIAERERVMDMEPAGSLAAQRQGEVIADLSRQINLAAENTRLRQQVADLETEANTLAASLRLAATLIRPNRESQ